MPFKCSKKVVCALCSLLVAAILCAMSAVFLFDIAKLKMEILSLKESINNLQTLNHLQIDNDSNSFCGVEDCKAFERLSSTIENLTRLQENFEAVGNVQEHIDAIENLTQLHEQTLSSILEGLNRTVTLDRFVELQQFLENISNLGQQSQPAVSCAALLPSSPSGYYWVRASNGSAVHVYCDMTLFCGEVTGGWTRVAELNMTNNTSQCPGDLQLRNELTCGIMASQGSICSSATFNTAKLRYSSVCGRIMAYQVGSLDAFHQSESNIENAYVDGVSLTHGTPRQHIWTFAASVRAI